MDVRIFATLDTRPTTLVLERENERIDYKPIFRTNVSRGTEEVLMLNTHKYVRNTKQKPRQISRKNRLNTNHQHLLDNYVHAPPDMDHYKWNAASHRCPIEDVPPEGLICNTKQKQNQIT